jgi:hypothetical protein
MNQPAPRPRDKTTLKLPESQKNSGVNFASSGAAPCPSH